MQPFDLWRPLMEQKPSVLVYVSPSSLPPEPWHESSLVAGLVGAVAGALVSGVVTYWASKSVAEREAQRAREKEAANKAEREASLFALLVIELRPVFLEAAGMMNDVREMRFERAHWLNGVDFAREVHRGANLLSPEARSNLLFFLAQYDAVERDLSLPRHQRVGLTAHLKGVLVSCHRLLVLSGALSAAEFPVVDAADYSVGAPLYQAVLRGVTDHITPDDLRQPNPPAFGQNGP